MGSIDDSEGLNCVGPLGLDRVVHPDHPWSINFSGQVGGTELYVGNISVEMVAVNPDSGEEDPALCSYTVEGEAWALYEEAGPWLVIDHTPATAGNVAVPLVITEVQGCAGQVLVGDPAYY